MSVTMYCSQERTGRWELGKAIGVSETAWRLGDPDTFIRERFSLISVPAQSIPVRFKDF